MSNLQAYLDEYELLTTNELDYIANGCGPKFGFLAQLVPDFCGIYTPACNLHDWIYWSGGQLSIRKLGDKKLKADMEKINSGLPWYKRWALSWAPRVYYSIVSLIGKSAYHEADHRRTIKDLKREMEDANF